MTKHWDEILSGEHRVIEKVLTVLVGEAKKLAEAGEKGKESHERVVKSLDFLVTFMDRCHNMKEEKVLFPKLEQRGIPRQGGPIGVMLMEHEKEREFLGTIKGNLSKSNWNPVLSESKNLAELVKDHVWKEDDTLYPMGKRVLSETDASKLVTGFEGIEKELGRGVHEKYHELAEKLVKETAFEPLVRNIPIEVLGAILDTIPVEVTFIDNEDVLRYFNKENEKKFFARPRAAIGRKVQKCHPQKSLAKVNQVLDDLRSGKKNVAEFWTDTKGRKLHIRYFAVRDANGYYLGTMEVVQDITEIKEIEGEKRLI
nr:PAS domain-containing protein [Candidatus Njordarchaeum guaymaensis]